MTQDSRPLRPGELVAQMHKTGVTSVIPKLPRPRPPRLLERGFLETPAALRKAEYPEAAMVRGSPSSPSKAEWRGNGPWRAPLWKPTPPRCHTRG